MNQIIKTDILSILTQVIKSIEHNEITSLKELSNHTIHNASIFQDNDSITMAIIVYSLYKILQSHSMAPAVVLKQLNKIEDSLAENNFAEYNYNVKEIIRMISKADLKLKLYIDQVIRQAEIKKGSKLYDHGISISQAASLMGISVWDLMNYIGKTEINEKFNYGTSLNKRISNARKIFFE